MLVALGLLMIASALELGLYVPSLWRWRRKLAIAALVLLSIASGAVLTSRFSLATVLLLFISLYRLFNLMRVVENRMHEQYLHHVALRTSLTLMGYQAIVGLAWWLSNLLQPSAYAWWLAVGVVQLFAAAVIFASTRRHLRTTRPLVNAEHFSDHDLPSISVCIPARNETSALEDCLRSLIASDYPKLEILVLDDMSHDKTPEVIRSFAHDGVRFIKGSEPPTGWLAKNWAYKRLEAEANGELLIFSGVDIQFGRTALRELVTTMLTKHKRMMSIIPSNVVPQGLAEQRAILLQPARYAWELSLPRRLFMRPPVLSSCWVIERKQLQDAGGFAAVARNIVPESYFAKQATAGDGYSFVQSGADSGIISSKTAADQWDTAVRTRYPQLHRRPEMVAMASLLELGCLVLPTVVAIVALVQARWLLFGITLVSTTALWWCYAAVVALTYRRFLLRGVYALPLAVLLNIYGRHESMLRYELGQVTWKGRNVTIPVMHVIPSLPKI